MTRTEKMAENCGPGAGAGSGDRTRITSLEGIRNPSDSGVFRANQPDFTTNPFNDLPKSGKPKINAEARL